MTLVAEHLVKDYRTGDGTLRAVDGVSFTVERGQTLGLVGESGCGKSTTARMLVRLEKPTSGRILLDGDDIASASGAELSRLRGRIQMVFQNPNASLNPRLTVASTLDEVLTVRRLFPDDTRRRARLHELLEMVGLGAESPRATRTSCPAASASAWGSRARWRSSRRSSCSTNRSRRSTSRCGPR